MGRLAILFGSLSLALTLSGCGMGKGAATASKAETASGGYGYLTAPYLTSVEVTAASVLVHGKSGRGARVRLSSPDGQAYGATATDAGVWVIEVPVQGLKGGADLFGLSEDFNGRIVQAEGYVALLSNRAIPAVLLRAGTGAETLTGGGPLRIGAVDFDDAGGVTVSGAAKAGEALKASLDGVMAAEGRVNDQGRYSFSLTGVARPGAHQIGVRSAQSAASAQLDLQPARLPNGRLFDTSRRAGWLRIDWTTPSGGVQSTLIALPTAPNVPAASQVKGQP